MLKIQSTFISQVRSSKSPSDLFIPLQKAIELEHSTIPPYLTALFSLIPGQNQYIRKVLHEIVTEEMLHMTIAANILNALGGTPVINNKSFIPVYPGPLPMGINEELIVELKKFSREQVKTVFMEIEEPEIKLAIPEIRNRAFIKGSFHTIGEFYVSIQEKIDEIIEAKLPGDRNKQVTSSFFPDDLLFPIITKDDAINAINIIIEQGEGTRTSPADNEGEIAHFYKFEELYKGKKIIKDVTSPVGYSFSDEPVPFDENGVFNIFPNTKSEMLSVGSEERRGVDQFNNIYSKLLNGLHKTFNGFPQDLGSAIGLMYDLKLVAEKLCAMPFPGKEGFTIGPPFEYSNLS